MRDFANNEERKSVFWVDDVRGDGCMHDVVSGLYERLDSYDFFERHAAFIHSGVFDGFSPGIFCGWAGGKENGFFSPL